MHPLLEKLFAKKGIEDPKQLDPEEKAIFDNWQAVLSKDELTVGDIREFCQQQLGIIETKWADYNLAQAKKAELIPYHTVYKTLGQAIDTPKIGREQLERHLKELTK